MFAPRTAKPQTEVDKSPGYEPARQRPHALQRQPYGATRTQAPLLQETVGNRTTVHVPASWIGHHPVDPRAGFQPAYLPVFLQPELEVGAVNDPLETEADRVAEHVMRMSEPAPRPSSPLCGGGEAKVQRKPAAPQISSLAPSPASSRMTAPPIVHEVLSSPGQPLDAATRAFFEPRFGRDFSQVRVHADDRAGKSARATNAVAYAAGQHLVFAPNQYSPTVSSSRRLIAHELAHIVQQRFAANSPLLQRQPVLDSPRTEEVSPKVQFAGHEGDDLAIKLLALADKGITGSGPYKDAIRTSGWLEKRYAYRNLYTLVRLADILDLPSYDQCVALLNPDPRGRVLAGMARIKKKYGLGEVSEDGATWSESELAVADRSFSKMTRDEQEMLHGVQLVRKKEIPPEERHGKTFPIAGRTIGGSTIELTQGAFRGPLTILHEAGHLIQQKQPLVRMEALRASSTRKNMEQAKQKFTDAQNKAKTGAPNDDMDFRGAMSEVTKAANALLDSPPESVQDNKGRLYDAEAQAETARASAHSQPWLDVYDRQKELASAVEQWATEQHDIQDAPRAIEESFVNIVKKYNLNSRSFAPFTDYVAHSWPDKPQEFLVQCYATWRADPGYMRSKAPKLFEWFESGGHLGKTIPTQ